MVWRVPFDRLSLSIWLGLAIQRITITDALEAVDALKGVDALKIVPICEGFGADVKGIDLAALTDNTFDAIYTAWLAVGVLRFKGQTLNKDSLQTFSQRFGPLEQIPTGRMTEEQKARLDNLYVTPISNIKVDGKPIGGLGDAEATWHSDMTYVEVPPPASVLLGVEIPQNGGDTYFADQRAALASLPDLISTALFSKSEPTISVGKPGASTQALSTTTNLSDSPPRRARRRMAARAGRYPGSIARAPPWHLHASDGLFALLSRKCPA